MRRRHKPSLSAGSALAFALILASQPAIAHGGHGSPIPMAGASAITLSPALHAPTYAPPPSGAASLHTDPMHHMPTSAPASGGSSSGAPGKSQTSSSSAPNPNTCDPKTSAACAAELTELQSETTPATPPSMWKQPADPPAPAANTSPTEQTIAPLSPQIPDTEVSSGGQFVPREPIPGGGPSLADCMDIWEPATHMSKAEWHTTCVRTLNGIDLIPSQVASQAPDSKPVAQRHASVIVRHHVRNAHGEGEPVGQSIAY